MAATIQKMGHLSATLARLEADVLEDWHIFVVRVNTRTRLARLYARAALTVPTTTCMSRPSARNALLVTLA